MAHADVLVHNNLKKCAVRVVQIMRWEADLLHDDAEGDPAAAGASGQIELAAEQHWLQVVGPVLLLHQVIQREVPLVLPHQPQRLLRRHRC